MPWLRHNEEVRPISLRRSLWLLIAVCVLPAIALSTFNVFERYRLYRLQIYSETQRLAENLIADVDRELAGVESGLKLLTTSEELRHRDFALFHKVAKNAVKSQIVYNYILTDSQGQQVLNTLVPFGKPLPQRGTPPEIAAVFKEKRTVLTGFFIGPVTGKPAVAMGVPVFNPDGEVEYSLNIGLAPEKLSDLLKHRPLDDGWLAALIDSSGTIVGRTRDEETFVGTKAVPALYSNIVSHRNGNTETVTKEGKPVVTGYATSKAWGWAVAVGAPKQLLETQLWNAFISVALTTGTIVVIAGWIALSIIRRLTYSVEALNNAALAINSGRPVELPRIQLSEADAIGRAIVHASKLTSEVHYKANHDALTDLPNRLLFYEFLDNNFARARRGGEIFSLLMIDLDHFKEVNDHEGHVAGDALLKAVAQRMSAEIREEDLAVRLGGDEFAILLVNADRDTAKEVADRVRASLAMPYTSCVTRISASIGVVSWRPEIADVAAMIDLADQALYRVKNQGRNAVLEAEMQDPPANAPLELDKEKNAKS